MTELCRSVRALAAAFLPLLIVAACSPDQAVVAPFNIAQSIDATRIARTARFSTTSTVALGGGGAREVSEAMGIVDLVAGSGRLDGTLTPNPFPPPSHQVASVQIEAIVVDGHGFQRQRGASEWRGVDGRLGSFLQVGNDQATFVEAMNEIVGPVESWSPAGTEEVRGAQTRHYAGVVPGTSGSRVEVWVDDFGRLRRVFLTRQGDAAINGVGAIVLELWDFGIAVSVQLPT